MKQLFIILPLLCLLPGCNSPGFTIVIPEAKIQEKLDQTFPFERKEKVLIRLSNPKVTLNPDDSRIGFQMDTTVNLLPGLPSFSIPISDRATIGTRMQGRVAAAGAIRFDRDSHALYISDPEVTKLEIEGLPSDLSSTVSEIVGTMLGIYLEKEPVYRITKKDGFSQTAKLFLKDVKVEDGQLKATFGL